MVWVESWMLFGLTRRNLALEVHILSHWICSQKMVWFCLFFLHGKEAEIWIFFVFVGFLSTCVVLAWV